MQQLFRPLPPFRSGALPLGLYRPDVGIRRPPEGPHRAFLGIRARLRHGVRHIDGHTQIHIVPIVVAFLRRRAVQLQVSGHLPDALPPHAGNQRKAQLAHNAEGIRRVGRNADGRVRLLVGTRRHHHIVHIVIVAVVVKAVVAPRLENDVQGFGETLPAFVIGNIIALIRAGKTAASDAEIQPPPGYVVHRSRFLRQPDGVRQRQHADPRADPHALRARRHNPRHQQGNRRHRGNARPARISRRARRREMPFRQPHPVNSRFVGQPGHGEGFRKSLVLGAALAVITFHYQTHVHNHPPAAGSSKTAAGAAASARRRAVSFPGRLASPEG